MESESTEIDFRSLEDELYDNEITQILSQPNTAESMYMFNYRRINIYFVFFYTDTNRGGGGGVSLPLKSSDGQYTNIES